MTSRLLHGTTRVRAHCAFAWTERADDAAAAREYEIEGHHCKACVAELRRIAPHARFQESSVAPDAPSVMIIDDDPDLRESLRLLLEDEGYAVTTAPHGRAALHRLLGEELPDLILLDLDMPYMNGWEFLRISRSYARLASVPVVIVSVKTVTAGSVRPSTYQAALIKPVSAKTLLGEVAKHVPPPEARSA